jgi:hypothetical protein
METNTPASTAEQLLELGRTASRVGTAAAAGAVAITVVVGLVLMFMPSSTKPTTPL